MLDKPNQQKVTQMEHEQERANMVGVEVRYWDGDYAEELLRKFFPVASMQYIDFVLEG